MLLTLAFQEKRSTGSDQKDNQDIVKHFIFGTFDPFPNIAPIVTLIHNYFLTKPDLSTMNIYPFVIIIIIILVIMWAYAAISKLLGLREFKQALATQIFPVWVGKILVWVLPISELAVVGLLVYPPTRLLGMYVSFTMMLLFTLYVGGAVYKIYDRYPCACGGLFARLGWEKHFKVNIFFTLISLIGIIILESGR